MIITSGSCYLLFFCSFFQFRNLQGNGFFVNILLLLIGNNGGGNSYNTKISLCVISALCHDVTPLPILFIIKCLYFFPFLSYLLFGNTISIFVPSPLLLVSSISAPWFCRICFTMARPNPVPPVDLERLLSTR